MNVIPCVSQWMKYIEQGQTRDMESSPHNNCILHPTRLLMQTGCIHMADLSPHFLRLSVSYPKSGVPKQPCPLFPGQGHREDLHTARYVLYDMSTDITIAIQLYNSLGVQHN